MSDNIPKKRGRPKKVQSENTNQKLDEFLKTDIKEELKKEENSSNTIISAKPTSSTRFSFTVEAYLSPDTTTRDRLEWMQKLLDFYFPSMEATVASEQIVKNDPNA